MPREALYGPGSAYHERRKHLAGSTVRCLAAAVELFGAPKDVIDFGCGVEGPTVAYLKSIGIPAIGFDVAIDETADGLARVDLREPLDLQVSTEWVLCWEVAEHLPADAADILCDTLARHVAKPGGRLLFTAAPPGQRGPGHIKCRPRAYWGERLEARGLRYLQQPTTRLAAYWVELAPRARWYGLNLQVFGWA